MIRCRALVDRIICGKRLRPGDLIDIPSEQAAAFLIDRGVVEPVTSKKAKAEKADHGPPV